MAEIDPGETLRWCDQPLASRVFRKAIPGAIFMCLVIGGFAAMCTVGGVQTWRELSDPAVARARERDAGMRAVWFFIGFGGAAMLGAAATLTAPWWARAKARRTVYAVTGTRVFTLERGRDGRVHTRAVEPGHPLSLSRREHADGSGDVVLYPQVRGQPGLLTLAATPEPRAVERLIRSTFDPPARQS